MTKPEPHSSAARQEAVTPGCCQGHGLSGLPRSTVPRLPLHPPSPGRWGLWLQSCRVASRI